MQWGIEVGLYLYMDPSMELMMKGVAGMEPLYLIAILFIPVLTRSLRYKQITEPW